MKSDQTNIYPTFDLFNSRKDKEKCLSQKSRCIWMTGLSGSGKTTIAVALQRELYKLGFLTQVLDGDNIRSGIGSDLDFSVESRIENIRRVAEITKLFLNCGIITINCFVSPTIAIRNIAKDIIGVDDFEEVFINTSFEECEKRDVKGLYKKAKLGEIKNFTGLDAPFEKPTGDHINILTENRTVEDCAKLLLQSILPKITYNE
jgi:adenylylsulfate kinase